MTNEDRIILFHERLIKPLESGFSEISEGTIKNIKIHRDAIERLSKYYEWNTEQMSRVVALSRHSFTRALIAPVTDLHRFANQIPHYEAITCHNPLRHSRKFQRDELVEWLNVDDNEAKYIKLWFKQKHNRLWRRHPF